ncbi:MAG: DNA repair protein RecO [Spirochaetales bacterium]|nr:DNA repair protein RecO [Spirochaetales bacterium]
MQRTFSIDGIVLKVNRISEIHKGLILFTREHGLFSCIAHGAYKTKGKLRALTEIFSYIKAYIYHDPVRDSYKLNDAETIELFSSFRKSVEKYYAVNLFAEVILKSFGGGEGIGDLYDLFLETLECVEAGAQKEVAYIIIQFGLRFLYIAGSEHLGNDCRMCNRSIGETENRYYRRAAHGFVCAHCLHDDSLFIPPGIMKYLKKTNSLSMREALKITLQEQTTKNAQTLVYLMVQDMIEKELVSLSGMPG